MATSNYPTNYDVFIVKVDGADFIMSDDFNLLQDAIIKLQKVLGKNPQGTYNTVLERLVALSSPVSGGVAALSVLNQSVSAQDADFWIDGTGKTNKDITKRLEVQNEGDNAGAIFKPSPASYNANSVEFNDMNGVLSSWVNKDGAVNSSKAIVSSVLTGTPPLQVSSTTVVPNLNAQMVGGKTVSELGSQVSIVSGIISDGETLPLPTGYIESECQWIVSPRYVPTAGDAVGGWYLNCRVEPNRIVRIYNYNAINGTMSGTANYLVIGKR